MFQAYVRESGITTLFLHLIKAYKSEAKGGVWLFQKNEEVLKDIEPRLYMQSVKVIAEFRDGFRFFWNILVVLRSLIPLTTPTRHKPLITSITIQNLTAWQIYNILIDNTNRLRQLRLNYALCELCEREFEYV